MKAQDSFGPSGRALVEQDFRAGFALSVAAPSAPLGLVERLRNGGQVDLADMAEGLLLALKEMVAMAENFDVDGERQDAAFKQAKAAIDAAMKG